MGKHEGAPIGVQIAAHAWREDLILEAGLQREHGTEFFLNTDLPSCSLELFSC